MLLLGIAGGRVADWLSTDCLIANGASAAGCTGLSVFLSLLTLCFTGTRSHTKINIPQRLRLLERICCHV